MNNPKLYTVKEAAKIVGVSTNTLYKYLGDDVIHAVRGSAIQGRFRIPESALEEFLGVKLSQPESDNANQLTNRITDLSAQAGSPISLTSDAPTLQDINVPMVTGIPEYRKTGIPIKVARFLLVLSLLAILVDLVISPSVSPISQLTRLFFVALMILLSYQEGGFRKS